MKGHLRIAHDIGEQLMVSNFTEQQRRILDLILRLSWGCGKEAALIPNQSVFEMVGIRRQHIKGHLEWLTESGVITRDDSIYSINRDFSHWRVSRALAYSPGKLKSLVKINLKHKDNNVTDSVTKEYHDMLRKTLHSTKDHVTKNVTTSANCVTKNVTPLDTNLASVKKGIKESISKDIPKEIYKEKVIIKELLKSYSDDFREVFEQFIKMRNKIRKPLTDHAIELALKELDKLASTEKDKIEIINQSIVNSWQGLFPLKNKERYEQNKGIGKGRLPTSYTSPEEADRHYRG